MMKLKNSFYITAACLISTFCHCNESSLRIQLLEENLQTMVEKSNDLLMQQMGIKDSCPSYFQQWKDLQLSVMAELKAQFLKYYQALSAANPSPEQADFFSIENLKRKYENELSNIQDDITIIEQLSEKYREEISCKLLQAQKQLDIARNNFIHVCSRTKEEWNMYNNNPERQAEHRQMLWQEQKWAEFEVRRLEYIYKGCGQFGLHQAAFFEMTDIQELLKLDETTIDVMRHKQMLYDKSKS